VSVGWLALIIPGSALLGLGIGYLWLAGYFAKNNPWG
jgi:hypothetical protein